MSKSPPPQEVFHRFGEWTVGCLPADGGRVSHLGWAGRELLTPPPPVFHPPQGDFGRYELRPVYAYDDCWPSVDACPYPGQDWQVPDHGEICWLPWAVTVAPGVLTAKVDSTGLPARFEREMHFFDDRLVWRFKITNGGGTALPCQHVMHPLLPLSALCGLELPEFETAWESRLGSLLPEQTPDALAARLLRQSSGTATMIYLQRVRQGRYTLIWHNGLRLEVRYPADLFPTLGIWWNNRGYPDEDGCRRDECAFEPVPGPTSLLTQAWEEGTCLRVGAGQTLSWECEWRVQSASSAGSPP